MLDCKDIIIKHYALHMSGRQIAAAIGASKLLIGILFDGSHIKLNLAIIDCNQCQWQGLRRDKSPIDTDFVYDVCQSSRA